MVYRSISPFILWQSILNKAIKQFSFSRYFLLIDELMSICECDVPIDLLRI